MKKTCTALLSLPLALLLATALIGAPQAQTKPTSAKKSKTETCDGALDIVPAKAMTFTRKRRPNKADTAPAAQPASKTTNELK